MPEVTAGDPGPGTSVERVVAHIEHLVFSLEPGDSLPSEGDLAKELGVNRLTVREGMRQLSARGLVEVRNGRRATVAVPDGRSVGDFFRNAIRRDPRALLDLLDVRRALEIHNASMAATRAGKASIDAMESAVQRMADALDDPDAFNDADVRFHELLAWATGNQMLATLIEELSDCLRTSRMQSLAGHNARGLNLDHVLREHQEILDGVRAHDARAAATAMRRHLRYTEKDLRAVIS